MSIQFNVQNARTGPAIQSLNTSRVETILKASSLDEAQRMGWFDKFKDIFRGGVKAEAIRQLYNQVTAPQMHETQPTDMLHRFERLRSLAIDQLQTQFSSAMHMGTGDQLGQWTFSLSVGGTPIYESDVLEDTHASTAEGFHRAQQTYQGINESIQRFRATEGSQEMDTSAIAELTLGAILNHMGDIGEAASPAEMFTFVKNLQHVNNPYLQKLMEEKKGDVSLLSLCFPDQVAVAEKLAQFDKARSLLTTELLDKVALNAANREEQIPHHTELSMVTGNTQDMTDDTAQRDFIVHNLHNPLFSSKNFRGIEFGENPDIFKAVFQKDGEDPHVLELSNRNTGNAEFRASVLQNALSKRSYDNLFDMMRSDYMGAADSDVATVGKLVLLGFGVDLGFKDGETMVPFLLDLQAYGPSDLANQTFDALRRTRFGQTNLLTLIMGDSAPAAPPSPAVVVQTARMTDAELQNLTESMMRRIRDLEPTASDERLQALTNTALQLYSTFAALSDGDETSAMQAFVLAQTYLPMDDPSRKDLDQVVMDFLTPNQRAKAHEAMRTSELIREINTFDFETMMLINIEEYDTDSREYKTFGILYAMSQELTYLRQSLNTSLNLPNVEDPLIEELKAKKRVLSDTALTVVNELRLASLERLRRDQKPTGIFNQEPLRVLTYAIQRPG
jgi:hypothetical protein